LPNFSSKLANNHRATRIKTYQDYKKPKKASLLSIKETLLINLSNLILLKITVIFDPDEQKYSGQK
jgi:hypothetical protein